MAAACPCGPSALAGARAGQGVPGGGALPPPVALGRVVVRGILGGNRCRRPGGAGELSAGDAADDQLGNRPAGMNQAKGSATK